MSPGEKPLHFLKYMDHVLSRLSPIILLPKSLENKTSTRGLERRVPQVDHEVYFLCALTTQGFIIPQGM